MKKYILLLIFLMHLCFYFILEQNTIKTKMKKEHENIIQTMASQNVIAISNQYQIGKYEINLEISHLDSKPDYIESYDDGWLYIQEAPKEISIKLTSNYRKIVYESYHLVFLRETSPKEAITFLWEKIQYPEKVFSLSSLPNELIYKEISIPIQYETSAKLDEMGYFLDNQNNVKILAHLSYEGIYLEKELMIESVCSSDLSYVKEIFESIEYPKSTISNLSFSDLDMYGIPYHVDSLTPSILSPNGEILSSGIAKFSITLYTKTMEYKKEYSIEVGFDPYVYSDRNFLGNFYNCIKNDNKVFLSKDALEGYYETKIYDTSHLSSFYSLIGSLQSYTENKSSAELLIRVFTNNTWSDYFSYGAFGFDMEKGQIYQSDGTASLNGAILSSKNKIEKIQAKTILRRNNTGITPYVYGITIQMLYGKSGISTNVNEVNHSVDKLYQYDVSGIGPLICGPTSSTMILSYYGLIQHSGSFPHKEFAEHVYDKSNQIYGNWVYNAMGISQYGRHSYVKYFSNVDELCAYIEMFGPVIVSVSGFIVTDSYSYETSGHLMVVSGYKTISGAKVFQLVDPAKRIGYSSITKQNFSSIWRNIGIVIE